MTQNKTRKHDFIDILSQYGQFSLQATVGDYWSKRVLYLHLLEHRPNQWVKGTYKKDAGRPMSRSEFEENANQRTVLDSEILLDVDDKEHDILSFTTIEEKAKFIYYRIKSIYNITPVCFFTRSKSYHISFFDTNLGILLPSQRKRYRECIIEQFGCDMDLANDNHTIALEWSNHYKSNKEKVFIEW